ncbi:MAG: translation initiation factor IF-2 subunit gamma [Candidatus Anstonellales archaeon]
MIEFSQPVVNIGLLGHVDHGKTTLTKAITGKWTDTHSEEIKRGISIRLGYADAKIYFCSKCKLYGTKEKCLKCGGKTELKRWVSFVDSPGHESLMTTAIAASSIIDGALLLIAANEPCPQPQTEEHLMILNILGIRNIIVVQTKIDLVSKERAIEHYKEIKNFLKGSVAENAPIIPVAAISGVNVEKVLEAIEKYIPTPKREENAPPLMLVSRSFDVNKPGTPIPELKGGVLGGSLVRGKIKIGDELEISPGIERNGTQKQIRFRVEKLMVENKEINEARPGGLVAIGTDLDPSLTKSDQLAGSILSLPGKTPAPRNVIEIRYNLLDRKDIENPPLKEGEPIVVNVYTATDVGVIAKLGKGIATIKLKRPMVFEKGNKAALSRRIGQRWRLAGWGEVV